MNRGQRRRLGQAAQDTGQRVRIGKMRVYYVNRICADKAYAELNRLPIRLIGYGSDVNTATDIAQLGCKVTLRYTKASNTKSFLRETLKQPQYVGLHSADNGTSNNLQEVD